MVVDWLGSLFTGLYAESFQFPRFDHVMPAWLLLVSIGITVGTAVLGTFNAIVATVRLAPAEAMRAPAPGRYRRTLVERLGITRISPALRMILRNMERRPLRTSMSIGGVAASVAIVVMGNLFRDEARRNTQLAQQGFIAPSKLEADRLALQAAQREVESAMAERRMAEHDLEQARAASGVVRQGSAMAG